jgi:hypothetical protein
MLEKAHQTHTGGVRRDQGKLIWVTEREGDVEVMIIHFKVRLMKTPQRVCDLVAAAERRLQRLFMEVALVLDHKTACKWGQEHTGNKKYMSSVRPPLEQ